MTLISEPLPPDEIKLHRTLSVNKGTLISTEEELTQLIFWPEAKAWREGKGAGR